MLKKKFGEEIKSCKWKKNKKVVKRIENFFFLNWLKEKVTKDFFKLIKGKVGQNEKTWKLYIKMDKIKVKRKTFRERRGKPWREREKKKISFFFFFKKTKKKLSEKENNWSTS